ncbi:MAG: OB-fold domain-containing protein [Deltaproteobacteria bacterium]|nr:OB-fold domain-containing protein [Deltaproteobacteria bacterium]
MAESKARVPAIEGWFRMDGSAPCLLGVRCRACGTVYFPRESFCRNPGCGHGELEETQLSRRGRLWSWTDNRYAPPPPFVAKQPFEPYTIAAVELGAEKMVVLGQVASGVDASAFRVGQEMELVLDALFEDDTNEYVIWKWRPVAA